MLYIQVKLNMFILCGVTFCGNHAMFDVHGSSSLLPGLVSGNYVGTHGH